MKYHQHAHHDQTDHWQQLERALEYVMLGFLGTMFTIYAQKIEALILGTQWLAPSLLVSAGILLAACQYRRQMLDLAAWYPVRIRNIEFQVRWDDLAAFYPLWYDLATSEDVSQADVLDALEGFARPIR